MFNRWRLMRKIRMHSNNMRFLPPPSEPSASSNDMNESEKVAHNLHGVSVTESVEELLPIETVVSAVNHDAVVENGATVKNNIGSDGQPIMCVGIDGFEENQDKQAFGKLPGANDVRMYFTKIRFLPPPSKPSASPNDINKSKKVANNLHGVPVTEVVGQLLPIKTVVSAVNHDAVVENGTTVKNNIGSGGQPIMCLDIDGFEENQDEQAFLVMNTAESHMDNVADEKLELCVPEERKGTLPKKSQENKRTYRFNSDDEDMENFADDIRVLKYAKKEKEKH